MPRLINFLLLCSFIGIAHAAIPQFQLPKTSLGPEDLAVIINDEDPLSRHIGDYYQKQRHIPKANLIHVHFKPGAALMDVTEFNRIKAEVDAKTPVSVQAFALTWAAPYRVDCMSITSAFAFGFNKSFCSIKQCDPTKPSPYFNSASVSPYTQLKVRPTMALAGLDFKSVKALIDRGIKSDGSHPQGSGYLLSTNDKQRNVRAVNYQKLVKMSAKIIRMNLIKKDYIQDKKDVMFYFTGLENVPALNTLRFKPGAIADHLTSAGGQLTDSSHQMSSLRWLEAGATGSYGSVVEPCNHLSKFPNPGLVTYWYLQGNTLIEAYWKSVQWPGEGIFIGEPLANPYGGYNINVTNDEIILLTWSLPPGKYSLLGSTSVEEPFIAESPVVKIANLGLHELRFKNSGKSVYRLIQVH